MAKTETNEKTRSRMSITEEDVKVYDTLQEAQDAGQPEGKPNWSLFQVTDPNGRMRWTWNNYMSNALWYVAVEQDKYSVIDMADAPTKAEVQGMLAALSAEDRAALLAQYAGTPGNKRK